MKYSDMDKYSLRIHHGNVTKLCIFLELVIRRGLETPEIVALYDKTKAELQKIEAAFYSGDALLKSKQDLIDNALKTFLTYVRSVYDPGNEYSTICDYNTPKPGYKTITLRIDENCDPEQLIEEMNDIDSLYGEFDSVMDDFAKDLPERN